MQRFKFTLSRLETSFPSCPRAEDWKRLGTREIRANSAESAARQIFATTPETDRVWLEDKTLEEPVQFFKEEFAVQSPLDRW